MKKNLTYKDILNMKIKNIKKICENSNCKDCPLLDKGCIADEKESIHTLFAYLLANLEICNKR